MISVSSSMAAATAVGGETSGAVPLAHCGYSAKAQISAQAAPHHGVRRCRVSSNPRATVFNDATALRLNSSQSHLLRGLLSPCQKHSTGPGLPAAVLHNSPITVQKPEL